MIIAHVCTRTPLRRLDQSGWKLLKKLPTVPDVNDYQHLFSFWELIVLHSYVYKLYTLCGIADLKTNSDMYVPTCLQIVLAFNVRLSYMDWVHIALLGFMNSYFPKLFYLFSTYLSQENTRQTQSMILYTRFTIPQIHVCVLKHEWREKAMKYGLKIQT